MTKLKKAMKLKLKNYNISRLLTSKPDKTSQYPIKSLGFDILI